MPLPKSNYYTSDDYWSLPDGERAELIDGQFYDMAPPSRIHQELVMELSATIRDFVKSSHGSCKIYPAPFAVNLDAEDKNWVEPDISIICDQNKLTDRGCSGAPDLIIEIVSPGSQRMDYLKKLLLYQKSGVREYWIVNPATEAVTVYDFEHDNSFSYTFSENIPVNIYDSFSINIQELLK